MWAGDVMRVGSSTARCLQTSPRMAMFPGGSVSVPAIPQKCRRLNFQIGPRALHSTPGFGSGTWALQPQHLGKVPLWATELHVRQPRSALTAPGTRQVPGKFM